MAAVFCTSGTTAAAKLAAHDQQSIVEHARNVAAATGMRPGDALLLALPAAGVFGFSGAMAARDCPENSWRTDAIPSRK